MKGGLPDSHQILDVWESRPVRGGPIPIAYDLFFLKAFQYIDKIMKKDVIQTERTKRIFIIRECWVDKKNTIKVSDNIHRRIE